MARPVTKSPPIQFRLPIELWWTLQVKAKAKGMTENEFVADYVRRALEAPKAGAK